MTDFAIWLQTHMDERRPAVRKAPAARAFVKSRSGKVFEGSVDQDLLVDVVTASMRDARQRLGPNP